MIWIFYITAILYTLSMVFAYDKILERRFSLPITIVMSIFTNAIMVYLVFLLPYSSLRAFGTLLVYIGNVLLFFDTDGLVALNIGGIYLVTTYCVRGMVFSIVSIALKISVRDVVDQRNLYYLLSVVATLIATGILMAYRHLKIKPSRVRNFYKQRTQLRFFVISMYSSLFFLVLLNDGRSLEIREKWFSIVYFVASFLTQLILVFIYNHLLELTEYIEREMVEASLIESLESKLDFYKELETQNLSIRKFKHDYKKVMSVMSYYIDHNDLEGMRTYLADTQHIIDQPLANEVQYSNHTLVDAMLQNAANRAKDFGITFDARVSVPDALVMKDLDLVRLFGNLIENALTAAEKVEQGFVNLIGIQKNNWFTIQVSNSYDGVVKTHEGSLVTTKEDHLLHGHGLRIIQEVTDQYYGVFTTQTNEEKTVFTAKVTLSLKS